MDIKTITEDCGSLQHTGLHERISVRQAKERYENRLNEKDSLNGFRFGIKELEDLIQEAKDKGALSLRLWKGRRKVHDMCPDPNNPDLPHTRSPEFYIEDLIIMPVLSDGTDMYAGEGTGNSANNDSKDIILASSRPCPEWCNVRRLEGTNPYFYQREDLCHVVRDINEPPALSMNHYQGKGCNSPAV